MSGCVWKGFNKRHIINNNKRTLVSLYVLRLPYYQRFAC